MKITFPRFLNTLSFEELLIVADQFELSAEQFPVSFQTHTDLSELLADYENCGFDFDFLVCMYAWDYSETCDNGCT